MSQDTLRLRIALIGLIGFASVEEELMLAAVGGGTEQGSASCWTARALVAHNEEFKSQQVLRLEAVLRREAPPAFAEIDHSSEEVYTRYTGQPADAVVRASRETSHALVDGLTAISDDDLLDPSRNPWLSGRKLWLQVAVRSFWHPTGHIGEYYLGHAQPERAVALQSQAVDVCAYLGAPDEVRGMACYNLACAHARAGNPEDALEALRDAIKLNSDLVANARRDTDFELLRESGLLDAVTA
jgi:hypothetical protein